MDSKKTVVIIGAGITGLTLGWKLSNDFNIIILENKPVIGGICGSFKEKGFILDYGPHKLYPQTKETLDEIKSLFADSSDLLEIKKKSKISLQGKYFNYPLKITEILAKFNKVQGAGLFSSYMFSASKGVFSRKESDNYEDFLISKFGKGLYELVFKSNANKIWGNPKYLSADLAKTRISAPNLVKVLLSSMSKSKDPRQNAEFFFYPKNSIYDLMERIAQKIIANGGKIILNANTEKINTRENKVTDLVVNVKDKKIKIKTDYLISTAHIKDMTKLMDLTNLDESVNNLKFRGLILAYIFFKKEKAIEDNWIFFPEEKYIFQRISEQKSFSSFNQPVNKACLVTEISLRPELENLSDKEIGERVVSDLEKAGIASPGEIYDYSIVKLKDVYPIYSLDYKSNLYNILDWFDNNLTNFITCGRNGLFNYNNMDHCIDMAIRVAEYLKREGSIEDMKRLRKYFESYKIVD